MVEHVDPGDARRALADIELRRSQIVDEVDVPAWYWWGLSLGWLGLGLLTVLADPWLTTLATLGFGAAHSVVAARVIDGRHGSRQLSVRADVVREHVQAFVIGFLLVLIALTVAIAVVADELGAPQPALLASVVVAIAVVFGGPQLMAFVRHRARRGMDR